ncbi:hypothetical protein J2Z21_009637 [Streptomyces griseochromogenes]|uniref:Uncharacterized protein n=1 Tax=Streptomyces griseochromogenes TaxID=68214 RepID=A0ABS4MAC9_9ACTN|nr:hypothetical protein [Streptomyces griseochromogenes]
MGGRGQGHVAVPARVTADLVVVQTAFLLRGLEAQSRQRPLQYQGAYRVAINEHRSLRGGCPSGVRGPAICGCAVWARVTGSDAAGSQRRGPGITACPPGWRVRPWRTGPPEAPPSARCPPAHVSRKTIYRIEDQHGERTRSLLTTRYTPTVLTCSVVHAADRWLTATGDAPPLRRRGRRDGRRGHVRRAAAAVDGRPEITVGHEGLRAVKIRHLHHTRRPSPRSRPATVNNARDQYTQPAAPARAR